MFFCVPFLSHNEEIQNQTDNYVKGHQKWNEIMSFAMNGGGGVSPAIRFFWRGSNSKSDRC